MGYEAGLSAMTKVSNLRIHFVFLLLGQLLAGVSGTNQTSLTAHFIPSSAVVSPKGQITTTFTELKQKRFDFEWLDLNPYTDCCTLRITAATGNAVHTGIKAFHIELEMPHYAEKGKSVILYCNYSLPLRELYKIEWQKNEKKIYQYVKDRRPPKKNFTIPGGTFDWNESNERQLKINNLDFASSGDYSCSASMEQPIYTKFSEKVRLTVFEKQQGDPQITLRKAAYAVGEVLELNCTSEPARPSPAVTWLLNGKEIDYRYLKTFHHSRHQNGEHLTSSTTQLTLNVMETHVGPSGFVELTCISTIPAYLDDEEDRFADKRIQTISVEVFHPQPTAAEATDGSSGQSAAPQTAPPSILLVLPVARLISYG